MSSILLVSVAGYRQPVLSLYGAGPVQLAPSDDATATDSPSPSDSASPSPTVTVTSTTTATTTATATVAPAGPTEVRVESQQFAAFVIGIALVVLALTYLAVKTR